MAKYASKVVDQARAWLGLNESDGSFKIIIDTYNSYLPHPRGYKMTYTAPWCAATVSAISIALGYTDIIPVECSCTKMIELLKQLGAWHEDESVVPEPGWLLLYDWDDNGAGDDLGGPEHIGIVESVSNGIITVIEGNYSNSVKCREIQVNSRYIRGYGVPKYDAEEAEEKDNTPTSKGDYTLEMRNLKMGCKGEDVRALQILLIGKGYSCGSSKADGIFGNDTHSAVTRYQGAYGLEVDGIAGKNTMSSLLGIA